MHPSRLALAGMIAIILGSCAVGPPPTSLTVVTPNLNWSNTTSGEPKFRFTFGYTRAPDGALSVAVEIPRNDEIRKVFALDRYIGPDAPAGQHTALVAAGSDVMQAGKFASTGSVDIGAGQLLTFTVTARLQGDAARLKALGSVPRTLSSDSSYGGILGWNQQTGASGAPPHVVPGNGDKQLSIATYLSPDQNSRLRSLIEPCLKAAGIDSLTPVASPIVPIHLNGDATSPQIDGEVTHGDHRYHSFSPPRNRSMTIRITGTTDVWLYAPKATILGNDDGPGIEGTPIDSARARQSTVLSTRTVDGYGPDLFRNPTTICWSSEVRRARPVTISPSV